MSVSSPRIMDGMYCGNMQGNEVKYILSIREHKVVDAVKNYIYNFPPELIIRSLEENRSLRSIIQDEEIDIIKEGYIGELRDYQTVGTAFMYASPRSIIGDGVGLGKTVQISALLNILKQKKEMSRFLMAVETSALGQTWAELNKYTGMNIIILPSTKKEMQKVIDNTDWNKADGILTTHGALKSDNLLNWVGLNLNESGGCRIFDTFILDESSIVKNQKTKQFDYLKGICNLCKRVHFMNATVFETSIMDIYNQVDLLYPDALPSASSIEREFSIWQSGKSYYAWDPKLQRPTQRFQRDRVGYKNQERFKQRLKLFYFGRSAPEVGLKKNSIYKVYEVLPTYAQSLALANNPGRYNEILNCPSVVDGLDMPFDRKNVSKLDRMCNLIENEYSDKKIMIYCFHIDAQHKIAEEMKKIGKKPLILNGQGPVRTRDLDRMKIITEFNEGDCDVIITNIIRSLNLYNGDVCFMYSMVPNPSKQTQIAGRIDRNVDEKTKTFILLMYAHTDEERMFKQVIGKREGDSRSLTIDAKGAVSNFLEALEENDGE